eukprot:CAMPEP_0172487570 /NCGR_PEP_ID=MMETSP1066-20121228/16712_1 /TAXON_ID=671091 /ORGANISM="Coscinodiscus wailesii, Strain CCMP2513" /LENGTH=112 /DNA_ID=CAMNT_0013254267 /DNA_START=233 /DNA_END=571 /DNA_ORIENTATION=-
MKSVGAHMGFDIGGTGPFTPGYIVVFDDIGVYHENGYYFGAQAGTCTSTPKDLYCTFTFYHEEHGSISFQGLFHSMTITGGTGCFEGARGSLIGSFSTDEADTYYHKIHAKF